MRTARIARKTNETDITLTICLDGRGGYSDALDVPAQKLGQIGRAPCRGRE